MDSVLQVKRMLRAAKEEEAKLLQRQRSGSLTESMGGGGTSEEEDGPDGRARGLSRSLEVSTEQPPLRDAQAQTRTDTYTYKDKQKDIQTRHRDRNRHTRHRDVAVSANANKIFSVVKHDATVSSIHSTAPGKSAGPSLNHPQPRVLYSTRICGPLPPST
jgi:hypothetical protein